MTTGGLCLLLWAGMLKPAPFAVLAIYYVKPRVHFLGGGLLFIKWDRRHSSLAHCRSTSFCQYSIWSVSSSVPLQALADMLAPLPTRLQNALSWIPRSDIAVWEPGVHVWRFMLSYSCCGEMSALELKSMKVRHIGKDWTLKGCHGFEKGEQVYC